MIYVFNGSNKHTCREIPEQLPNVYPPLVQASDQLQLQLQQLQQPPALNSNNLEGKGGEKAIDSIIKSSQVKEVIFFYIHFFTNLRFCIHSEIYSESTCTSRFN